MINISFCYDDNLAEWVGATITSLLVNRKGYSYHIFCIHSGLKRNDRCLERIVSFFDENSKITIIHLNNKYINGHEDHGITSGAYLRLMLPEVLKEERKTIYSDVDVVFNDSLYDVWNEDINDFLFLGVRNELNLKRVWQEHLVKYPYWSKLERGHYINTGFVVMNLDAIRREKLLMERWGEMVKDSYYYVDQDIINITVKSDRKNYIPLRYNSSGSWKRKEELSMLINERFATKKECIDAIYNPAVIHYNSFVKPWRKRKGLNKRERLWWKYYLWSKCAYVLNNDTLLSPYKKLAKQWKKPELPRLEIHICDHCNLNCKSCSHFSNIADEWYADVEQYENDLIELSKKIMFREIKILGGETLLHSRVQEFVSIARKHYPKSKIILITNGILLPKFENNRVFWSVLRNAKAELWISVYPPFKNKAIEWAGIVRRNHVFLKMLSQNYFWRNMNRAGNSDANSMYRICEGSFCRQLREGRLYICPQALYLTYYNKYFNEKLPSDPGIDIYNSTTKEIIEYITSSKTICSYCTDYQKSPWEQSSRLIDEWDSPSSC